jgi:serine palmitoyltransferase
MGSLAIGLCAGGGFCAGDANTIAHQRINSAAYVFSASLPPLLAVAANEGISYLAGTHSTTGQLPLGTLGENVKIMRTALDKIDHLVFVPSSTISPLIHVHIRSINGLSFYDQEHILQEIVDDCMHNGVLISRTKKVWKQEAGEGSPSLRILISSGLPRKEMEKAANVVRVGPCTNFFWISS